MHPGHGLVLTLAVTVRTAAYYDADNAVMLQTCANLGELLAECCEGEDSVTVGVQSHCVFVDRVRVRTTVSTYARFSYVIQLFESWGMNTLTFLQGVTEEELLRLALVLARERPGEEEALAEMLISRGIHHVKIDMVVGTGTRQAIAPVEAYAAAMQMSDELGAGMDSGEPIQVRRLRHVTQAVVDQILRDPGSLVALTTIKDFDRYLISHSTNVAVLSVLLGQRLGLSKSRLGELCLAAFLHDAGKLEVMPDVLHKPGALNVDEWEEMRRHPVLAAYSLLGAGRCTPSSMMAVVVAFEHHLNHDLSGYPRPDFKDRVTLFGSIVAVADRYDALTTARVYREYNYTPYEALGYLIQNAGTLFDPTLVKLFVEIMGLYPPGTLVELSSGDLAVVCAAPALGSQLDKPQVRLVGGEQAGSTLDLGELGRSESALRITRVLNPANKGQIPAVDLSVFALAD
jgi:HD-GYP domain-containing protein (c-di-GMP phosphodiesterase class II)